MQKIILFVLILALSACSAPAPAVTSTTMPTLPPTHTATVTFTATPEPTPTMTPPPPDPLAGLPEGLRAFAKIPGNSVDLEKGVIFSADGLVLGFETDKGWVDSNACLPFTQQDGSVVCNDPIYTDGKSVFEYMNANGLTWNDLKVMVKPPESVIAERNRRVYEVFESFEAYFDYPNYRILIARNMNDDFTYFTVMQVVYGGRVLSLFEWAPSSDDYNSHFAFSLGGVDSLIFDNENFSVTDR